MKIARIICLLVVLCMAVTVLSACASSGSASVSVPADVDADGRFIYTIVRSEKSTQIIGDAAKSVRSAIKENMGCTSAIAKDSVIEAVDGTCEILIGNTNRPESLEALKIVEENRTNNAYDFIVKVINNKICIQATTDEMVSFACDWFTNTFCQSFDTWALLKSDYEFLYAPESDSVQNAVAGVDLGRFTVVKPLKCSFLFVNEMDRVIDFYNGYGLKIALIEDADEEVTNEILIGDTSREESKSVTVEGDNYVIKVVGTKLVIKGGNDLATYRAVKHFADLVIASEKGETINWTDGYVINGKYDAEEKGIYTLNFYDEFEGSKINLDKWGDNNSASYRTGSSTLGGLIYGTDPSGHTSYTGTATVPKMIYQSDGVLTMAAAKLDDKDFMGTDMATFSSMWFKYGLVEINAQMAPAPAAVSLWFQGTGEQNVRSRYGDISRACQTEIDLLENYGSPNWFGSAIHRWWTNYSPDMQSSYQGHDSVMSSKPIYQTETNSPNYSLNVERNGGDLTETFNTFSMYWDDESIKFAFNGKQYCEYFYKDEMSVSVHCILVHPIFSNWMGRAGYGATFDPNVHPSYSEFKMDYIRIYQTDAIGSQMLTGDGQYVKSDQVSTDHTVVRYPEHGITSSYR